MSLTLDRCSLGTNTIALLSAALGVEPLVLEEAEGSITEHWEDSDEEGCSDEGGNSNEEGYSDEDSDSRVN